MIRMTLNDEEKTKLIKLREGSISEHSEKALMVLLSNEGKSPQEIGKILQRNPHTVRDWLKRYKNEGIEGFRRLTSPGRPADKRNSGNAVILEIIDKNPSEYGFHANSWTAQLIVEYLKAERGMTISVDTVKRALKKTGYSFKRPTKAVPAGTLTDEEKRTAVQDLITEIQTSIQQGMPYEIFSLDESHFSTDPYMSRGWIRRGEKKTSFVSQTRSKNAVWCLKFNDKAYVLQKRVDWK